MINNNFVFNHLNFEFEFYFLNFNKQTKMKNFIKHGTRTLISGNRDNSITIRDLVTGKLFKTLIGHSKQVSCLKLLKDDLLASGSFDCSVRLWNLLDEKCLTTLYGSFNC